MHVGFFCVCAVRITEYGSTLYIGITVKFLNNWVLDNGIIQANKLQKLTTRLQIDLHCVAGHKTQTYVRVPVKREIFAMKTPVLSSDFFSSFFLSQNFQEA